MQFCECPGVREFGSKKENGASLKGIQLNYNLRELRGSDINEFGEAKWVDLGFL